LEQNESDFQTHQDRNEICGEVNIIQAFMGTTEISINDAIEGPHAKEWEDAMVHEVNNILARNTWKIVDRPKTQKVIGSRFVLTNKLRSDGSVHRRKARLVARGFSQKPGVDFEQSFAPVARLESLRLLVAVSARQRMIIHQVDAVTAYLNSRLDEQVYMEIPETLDLVLKEIIRRNRRNSTGTKAMDMLNNIQGGNKVCLLERALYGLRQAGRQWNIHLDKILRKLGLKPTVADPCLYMSKQKGKLSLALVYVDDILLASEDFKWTENIIRKLSNEIQIKNLDKARNCLGIEIDQTQDGIKLSQSGYIMNILKRFDMEQANPVSTPAEPNTRKNLPEAKLIGRRIERPYRQLVGALTYLAIATRPDITYVTSYLGQFNHNHTEEHWSRKRVLRYLRGTINLGLHFRHSLDPIVGYTDAD